jgi:trigger factor
LKIETQARDDHQTKLIAELDAEMLDRYMQRAARKISRETRIPGFRPGKAPYEVVRRMPATRLFSKKPLN